MHHYDHKYWLHMLFLWRKHAYVFYTCANIDSLQHELLADSRADIKWQDYIYEKWKRIVLGATRNVIWLTKLSIWNGDYYIETSENDMNTIYLFSITSNPKTIHHLKKMHLTSLSLRDVVVILIGWFSNSLYRIVSQAFLMKLLAGECQAIPLILLMESEHCRHLGGQCWSRYGFIMIWLL